MKTKFKSVIHAARHFFGGVICAGTILLITSTAQAQNLFVAAANSGHIYEYTNNAGTLSSNAFIFPFISNPIPLAFDSAGNLFVGSGGGNRIYEYTNNAGMLSSNSITFAFPVSDPQGMAFDSKGDLFVSAGGHNILEFTNNAGTLSSAAVTFASGLSGPAELAFDSAGNLFEADSQSNQINEFTNNAGMLSSIAVTFAANLTSPEGLAFDSKGDLFVATIGSSTFGAGNIYEFTNNGVALLTNRFTIATGLSYPVGLVFDSTGNLFVANSAANTIVEYTNNAGILSSNSVFAYGVSAPAFMAFAPNSTPNFSVDIKMFAGVILKNGQIGSNYLIQAKSNVNNTNWITLTNVTLPSNPYIYIDYSSPTNRQQFYRATNAP